MRPTPRVLLLCDKGIEPLVSVGAGLIDGLLLKDQILYGLTDEFAGLRVGDNGIADFRRALRSQDVERGLPLLAHRLFLDPLAIRGIAGDGRSWRRDPL